MSVHELPSEQVDQVPVSKVAVKAKIEVLEAELCTIEM